MRPLSSAERVLLHLKSYWNIRGELPSAITQDGIAQATNMRRTHIPRTLQKMKRDGSVEERMEHVAGLKRRIKTYFLTEIGFREAQEVLSGILGSRIVVRKDSDEKEMSLGDACTLLSMRPLEVINLLTPDDVLILTGLEGEEFLDRTQEIEAMKRWFQGRTRILALYGSVGVGKTTLAKRFLREIPRNWRVVWYDLADTDPTRFYTYFTRFLGRDVEALEDLPEELCKELRRSKTLLIFDGYFEVHEYIVDFFASLCRKVEPMEGAKMLFLINEATPFYCRFYKLDSIKRGAVEEMHLKGLEEAESFELLGARDIEEGSFKRIFHYTKGNPLYLKLIRDEKVDEMKRRSRFTLAEIKLLIHFKNTRKE